MVHLEVQPRLQDAFPAGQEDIADAVPAPEPIPEEVPVEKGKAKKGAKLFVDESFNPGKGNILAPIEFTVTEREEEPPVSASHDQ